MPTAGPRSKSQSRTTFQSKKRKEKKNQLLDSHLNYRCLVIFRSYAKLGCHFRIPLNSFTSHTGSRITHFYDGLIFTEIPHNATSRKRRSQNVLNLKRKTEQVTLIQIFYLNWVEYLFFTYLYIKLFFSCLFIPCNAPNIIDGLAFRSYEKKNQVIFPHVHYIKRRQFLSKWTLLFTWGHGSLQSVEVPNKYFRFWRARGEKVWLKIQEDKWKIGIMTQKLWS